MMSTRRLSLVALVVALAATAGGCSTINRLNPFDRDKSPQEQASEGERISIVAADQQDLLKKLEKDGKMSQDEHRGHSEKVQELTDKIIKEIDQTLAAKETEIQKV